MQSLARALLKLPTNGSINSSSSISASMAPLSCSGSSNGGLMTGMMLNNSDAKVKWNEGGFSTAAGGSGSGARNSNGGGVGIGETPVEEFSTRFGSQKVDEGEKAAKVHDVFDSVASDYDLMNDFMSAGIHRLWKDELVYGTLNPRPKANYLDLAGGTGDIAFRIHAAMARATPGAPTGRPNGTLADIAASTSPPVVNTIMNMAPKIVSTLLGAPPAPPGHKSAAGAGTSPTSQVALDPVANPLLMMKDAAESTESWKKLGETLKSGPGGVVVCDITADMLAVGQRRIGGAADLNSSPFLSWVEGNAEELPFEDDSFDGITMAFGLRNTSHLDAVMRETLRVLKPGGRFLVLEFSTPPNPVFRQVYDTYSYAVIPPLGQAVAGDRDSYQYLVESIRAFPRQATLASLMADEGYVNVTYTNLTGGICAIHSGFKPV